MSYVSRESDVLEEVVNEIRMRGTKIDWVVPHKIIKCGKVIQHEVATLRHEPVDLQVMG